MNAVSGALLALAWAVLSPEASAAERPVQEKRMTNPSRYFEIPVLDMDRAMRFYSHVFKVTLQRETVDGYDMALFPSYPDQPGASGALAKGDVYIPSITGSIVYFDVSDIAATVHRATGIGAKLLYPIKDIGGGNFVAEISDSEGNRIALHQRGD